MSDDKQLAIIRKPRLGASDRGTVALRFTVYVTDVSAALQVLWLENDEDRERAFELLRTVSDIRDLDGKACWVDTSSPGLIRYVKPAKMGSAA